MTTPTNKLIEEAVENYCSTLEKERLYTKTSHPAFKTVVKEELKKLLSTLLTKHEDAVLEREALALEGMKKKTQYGRDTSWDIENANGFNQALRQAADHLQANKSNHE